MKTIRNFSAVLLLALAGCATTAQFVTPENARIATRFVASKALQHATSNENRVEIANYLYSAALGLRSISVGQGIPHPDLVRSTIRQFLKPGDKWTSLANSLADVYAATIWPNIQGKPAEAWRWIEAMSVGLEEAAGGFTGP